MKLLFFTAQVNMTISCISFLHDSDSRMLNTCLTLSLLCFYLSLYIVPWCQWFCTGKETAVTRRRRQGGVGRGTSTVTTGHTAGSFYEYTARLVHFLSCGTLESLAHSKPKAFLSLMSLFISIYNTPIWFLWFFSQTSKRVSWLVCDLVGFTSDLPSILKPGNYF